MHIEPPGFLTDEGDGFTQARDCFGSDAHRFLAVEVAQFAQGSVTLVIGALLTHNDAV